MSDERTFVIVGASLAGAKAAETLRAEGFTGRIVLIGEETDRPYERPPLSKGYLLGKEPRDKAYVHDPHWYATNDVDLVLGVQATTLDPRAHTVTLDDVEPLRYDKLLLATGSRVRHLDVPGIDNMGVRYLRRITEADTLREDLREGAQVLVVGAGWIGLETAAAARAAPLSARRLFMILFARSSRVRRLPEPQRGCGIEPSSFDPKRTMPRANSVPFRSQMRTISPASNVPSTRAIPGGSKLLPLSRSARFAPSSTNNDPFG